MESVLLVIHLIVAISIIALVLIQPAESGGFMGSSNSNMMMPRRTGDVLTRATTLLAGIFFMTSMFLAIAASHRPVAKSILDDGTATPKPGIVIKTDAVQKDATDAATAVKKEAADKAADAKDAAKATTTDVKKPEVKPGPSTPKAPVTK